MRTNKTVLARVRRHKRVREKIQGTPERPRLSVYRSLNHTYVQVVDDLAGKTLMASSTAGLAGGTEKLSKADAAKVVGKQIAVLAKEARIEKVVFDRGGYLYHGRVKALAEGAREEGLLF
jgi:large subunit ribosomal protein L18